jgi:hypothetical protein
MIIYSIIMAWTVFACIHIVIRQFCLKDDPNLVLGNNVFIYIVMSTISTIGPCFVMSFMYLDPRRMFTSFLQYLILLPSYICTLQIYAICNTHDVTWGTMSDNLNKTDLGIAKGDSKVVLETPSKQLDIDSGYDEALRNLRDRVEVPKQLSPRNSCSKITTRASVPTWC